MGKKTKKNRFNKSVDVDVVYSTNTIAEVDPTDGLAELNISKEKAEELQKIRAKLPTFSQTNSVESELAKLPNEKPFRAFVYNMAYAATQADVIDFFAPLEITNVNVGMGEKGPLGYCLVDFATRDDLAKALQKNNSPLAGRPASVRIATSNNSDRGGYGREKNSYGGFRRSDSGFERRREGYRPAALRDELPESTDGSGWHRGETVNRGGDSRPSFGFSRPSEPRPAFSKPEASVPTGERAKVNILPRTAPMAKNDPPRDPKIFGHAKPVDTAAKDREIEERIAHPTAAQ